MKRRYVVSVLLLGGTAMWSAITARLVPNPIVYLRSDAATLILLITSFMIIGSGALIRYSHRQQRARESAVKSIQEAGAAERRRFLARLDHELKNPLTTIQAGLANLAETPSHATIQSMRDQTVRLSRLVADLRKLAELETMPLEMTLVEPAALLEDVFQAIRNHPASLERTLRCTIPQAPWPLPAIRGDLDLLFLAFYNLLDNAIKFTHPGQRIELRASDADGLVQVEIADTGIGIAAADLPLIWEELFRSPRARGTPGSGLGLSLTRTIIMRHQGTIQIRSRPDQGTVVSVRLPASVTKS